MNRSFRAHNYAYTWLFQSSENNAQLLYYLNAAMDKITFSVNGKKCEGKSFQNQGDVRVFKKRLTWKKEVLFKIKIIIPIETIYKI